MILLNDVQGHWVRDWIKAPSFEDHTTRVHWIQAGLDYADVRIPLNRPDLGAATCLADLDASSLHALGQAEGFVGHITLHNDTCTWHREVNWHGAPDAPDVGAIAFDEDGRMIETGVLAEYTELWEQHTTEPTKALRLHGRGYSGLMVSAGDICVLGIGQPLKSASQLILDTLQQGNIPKDVFALFDGIHAVCQVTDGCVIPSLATTPFAEGTPILTMHEDSATWHHIGFDGQRQDVLLTFDRDPA